LNVPKKGKGNSGLSKNKIHTLNKIIYIVLCVIAVLAYIYVVFGFEIFKIEDLDLIKAVKDKAISANVLLIQVTEESGSDDATVTSTSYSAGHSGVVFSVVSFVSECEFTVLPIAPEPPEYNEPVVAIGNPHENTRNVITTGRITSRNPVPFGDEAGKNQHNVITHSARISVGSSGGALLNKNMEIIGINLGGSENMFRFIEGKAMPCDKILEFLRGINIVL
jgi:hypothetical protein